MMITACSSLVNLPRWDGRVVNFPIDFRRALPELKQRTVCYWSIRTTLIVPSCRPVIRSQFNKKISVHRPSIFKDPCWCLCWFCWGCIKCSQCFLNHCSTIVGVWLVTLSDRNFWLNCDEASIVDTVSLRELDDKYGLSIYCDLTAKSSGSFKFMIIFTVMLMFTNTNYI